ncbi:MAG: hypothetical protein J7K75_11290 [Desulfuromonas sp.]|nr:hypothetical protein [Desulfuromonas sp.]
MIHESRRVYGKVKKMSLDSLQQAFTQLSYVKIALLFGSRADPYSSKVNAQSDYDFAVLMDKSRPCDWGHLAQVRTELGTLLALPDEDFDVVDLEIASPALMASIREQYQVIKGDCHDVRCLLGEHHKDS